MSTTTELDVKTEAAETPIEENELHAVLAVAKQLDWLEHVEGNLFKVKVDAIQTADGSLDTKLTDTVFRDPRSMILHQGGKKGQVTGISKQEMDEKREDIRIRGLMDPLILRWVKNENADEWIDPAEFHKDELPQILSVQVVDGHLRLRCIKKLRSDKAKCYNSDSGQVETAQKVYDYILCRIMVMDHETAYRYAYNGNDKSTPMGDAADVANVRQWRRFGWDDAKILQTTGHSPTWLKDMNVVAGLDEQCFDALANKEINLAVAKVLAKVEDLEERLQLLSKAKDAASERIAKIQLKLQQDLDKADAAAEIAEAAAADADHRGDSKGKDRAQKRLEKAGKRRRRLTDAALAAGSRRTAGSRDLQDGPKKLTHAKVRKHWYDPVCLWLKEARKENPKDPLDDIDVDDARLVKKLIDAQNEGETDLRKVLRTHKKDKEKK